MSGSQYIALSGLRARADDLDRIAADIANLGTAGYKGERQIRAAAERSSFDRAIETAIDTTFGGRRLDARDGAIATTGRSLDLALEGPGFFVVTTPAGDRYTRNGHFTLDADRKLVTEEGFAVKGASGAITLGDEGDIRIDADGTVWTGSSRSGQLALAEFDDPSLMTREQGSLLGSGGQAAKTASANVHNGSLEQSNVTVADRLAELTTVSRGFEALQKALSVLMNEIDGRAVESLGRK